TVAMRTVLVSCLLVISLQCLNVLGQDLNQTIDLGKLALKIRPFQPKTRVVGGDITTNEELGGYMIALRYSGKFICGGTLIHELIVLSAAHCFIGRPDKSEWVADGGISTLSEIGERRQVVSIIKSAQFRESDMNMDVALVKLAEPMVGEHIGILELCSEHLRTGTVLRVSGWGMLEAGSSGPEQLLRTVTVPIVDKKQCREVYKVMTTLTDSMFCASVLGRQDACTFDSGGPLVYENQVCGIVSFGIGCASKTFPGIYTDVAYIKPFILKSMEK
ncbi:hypothetical protein KR009_006658, partial [Drosophila setifemur]